MSRELVRAIYDPLRKLPENSYFYKHAISEIEYFGIASQIYYLLKTTDRLENTPYFFQNYLENNYKKVMKKNFFMEKETEDFFKAFEAAQIETIAIPLNGVRFAEKYFRNQGASPASHISLLVKKKDLCSAMKVLKALGYSGEENNNDGMLHVSFRNELPEIGPFMVELHWGIIEEHTAGFEPDELWDRANSIEGFQYVKELSDFDAFYMVCLHGWKYNLASLKHFIDIIQMLHCIGWKIDYANLFAMARTHKTYKRIVRILSIVYREFPHLNLINSLPRRKSLLFWDYQAILPGSRKKIKHYLDYLDYQLFSQDKLRHLLKAPKSRSVHIENTVADN